jgi:hypothetical protein
MDWVSAKNPIETVVYDVRNPPQSAVIATYAYSGPPTGACGNPTITLSDGNGGPSLAFLIATFDPTTKNIAISLPE